MYNHIIKMVNEIDQLYDNDLSSTFGHIVIADYNFEDGHIQWCLEPEREDEWRKDQSLHTDQNYVNELCSVTRALLELLLTIPEDKRYV